MQIEEIIKQIKPVDQEVRAKAQYRFDNLIKPVGSLAKLEEMTTRYAAIIGKDNKNDLVYPKRVLLEWASINEAQHAAEVMSGSCPVNVLAAQTGAEVESIIITAETAEQAMVEGSLLVKEHICKEQLGLLGYGCLADYHNETVIAAMAGGILQAAALRVPVMLDGLATCLAAKKAAKLAPLALEYCYAGHVSSEPGAEEVLRELGLSAPLRLDIASGAGEGAAVAFTLFNAGIKAYKEMETFEEAGVHVEVKEFSHAEQVKEEQQAKK